LTEQRCAGSRFGKSLTPERVSGDTLPSNNFHSTAAFIHESDFDLMNGVQVRGTHSVTQAWRDGHIFPKSVAVRTSRPSDRLRALVTQERGGPTHEPGLGSRIRIRTNMMEVGKKWMI
jgi:hypothetical protein